MQRKILVTVLTIALTFCSIIGLTACGHEHEYEVQTSSTMHWYKCECGDTYGYDVHMGGEATCKEKAICLTCNEEYGEIGEHTGGKATCKEKAICLTCNEEYGELGEHAGGEATCKEKAICSICNEEYGELGGHAGGEATCKEKAICSTCNEEYGELEHCEYEQGYCKWCKKEQSKGLLFAPVNDTEYSIVGLGAFTEHELIIPSLHLDKPVTSIGAYAFADCTSLTSIEIPDSVTSIGAYAFADCTSLTSIEIPDSVTSIGSGAFESCVSLINVNYLGAIDDWVQINFVDVFSNPLYYAKSLYINVVLVIEANITTATKINDYAFFDCSSLTSIVIGDSVTSIGDCAFYDCTSLTSVVIGDSVTSIGDCAFYDCTSLTGVVMPNSVTSAGYDVFYNCISLHYNEEGNLKYLGNATNPYMYLGGTTSTSITSATINSNCKIIGDDAFSGCTSLTSIQIPCSVTSIVGVFYGVPLTNIQVDEQNSNYKSIDGSLYSKDGKKLIRYAVGKTNAFFIIPNSVTSIGDASFGGCTSLTSLVIGDSVTSIDEFAFSGCTSLTNVVIGNGVTSIGDYAFSSCVSLTNIKYRGTETQWEAIYIGMGGNSSIFRATISFNYNEE